MMKCCKMLERGVESGFLKRELIDQPNSIDPSLPNIVYEEIRFPPRNPNDVTPTIDYCPFCGERL